MTITEVLQLLEENKNERGILNWEKSGNTELSSYGIGLTQLKQLSKKIGKDHQLALDLWEYPNYETKTIATMVDNPKQVTKKQAESQVEDAKIWILSHSYCSNLLSKVDFKKELAIEWTTSESDVKRRCAFLLLYHIAKDDKQLEDNFFATYIDLIENNIQEEEYFVKDAMNNSLLAIGKRSKNLNEKALEAARNIGNIEVDYGENSCKPADVIKHLTSKELQKKFN
jgi:3-methyladenine DNA glycosylase AlkD